MSMNFTSEIKKELLSKKGEPVSAIAAFLKTSGDAWVENGVPAFYFVSERERVAEYFMSAFLEAFDTELFVSHATKDKMSGRDKLVLQCPAEHTMRIAKALGIIKKTGVLREGVYNGLIGTDEKRIAYIRGAFLGGGSCSVPTDTGKTGYHLEIVFHDKKTAGDFCRILADFEILAKRVSRKESYVVYLKSKELISDFLAVMGAENSLKKLSAIVEKRDRANNDNRARNCIAGNADKMAIAAVKQVQAIEKLRVRGELGVLSVELHVLAKARLENPTMSLQELADKLGVSKSCLNHRMRKLMELAGEIEE